MTCNLQNIYLKARSYKYIHRITKNNRPRNVEILFAIAKIAFITKGSLQKYISSCWYLSRCVSFICCCRWVYKEVTKFCFSDIMYNFFLHPATRLHYPSICMALSLYNKIYVQIILSTCVSVSLKRPCLSCLSV